ncbi:hypothetical protein BJY04DRAFT_217953 [Aspergillus karnatakaensis]|uniref:uncharacterized protein n=1 Tax=Aspergillus karnatakaensis TaxID=1810916 RepID=UPI003CCDDD07
MVTYGKVIRAFQKTLAAQSRDVSYGYVDRSIASLDSLIDDAQNRLPQCLKCVDASSLSEEHPGSVSWCSNNHAILMYMRYLLLRLCVRLTTLASVKVSEGHDFLTRQADCLEYASRIVQYLAQLPAVYGVFYSPYVARCSTLMRRLVHRLPRFRPCYRDTILKGIAILRNCDQNNTIAARLSTLETWLGDALNTTATCKRTDKPFLLSPGSLGRSFIEPPYLSPRREQTEALSTGTPVGNLGVDRGVQTLTSPGSDTYLDVAFDMEMELGDPVGILTGDIQGDFYV